MKNASVNVQANFNDDIVGSGSNAPFNNLNQHTIRVFGAGTDYLTLSTDVIDEIITTGYQDDTPSRHLGRYIQEVNAGASSTTEMEVALIYKPDRFFRGGDHESFLDAGFPAVRFTEPQEDFYHQHQDPRVQDGITYGDDIQYVDFDYTARVGKVNLLSLWSIANAPATPSNFTYDTNIGFLATTESTPASYLENVIKLYWNTEPTDSLLAYYEIVWRPLSSQQVCAVSRALVYLLTSLVDAYAECRFGEHSNITDQQGQCCLWAESCWEEWKEKPCDVCSCSSIPVFWIIWMLSVV